MTYQKKYSAQEMLQAFSVSIDEVQIFHIGCFSQRLTLHAQQIRAYNLVWALLETKKIGPGADVAIVGGGLAGLTAAAACNASGAKVTLYEEHADVLHLQRGNRLRYLHPNIYDWPLHEAEDYKTRHLPFLQWAAGFCDEVSKEILDQWQMIEKRITLRGNCRVTKIKNRVSGVELEINGSADKATHDLAILSVGYGHEKTIDGVQRLSYWQNDSLCQPVFFQAMKRILVTGCGDGGLTDALRLTLKDFNHARFILDIAITFSQELRSQLAQIDVKAYAFVQTLLDSGAGTEEVNLKSRSFLNLQYEDLLLPRELIRYLEENRRQDTEVILNNRGPVALTLEASPINRFAIYCLIQIGAVKYIPGDPKIRPNPDGTYSVQFEIQNSHVDSNVSCERVFDDIVVRRGVDPVISDLIDREDFARLKSSAVKDRHDLTRVIHFPGMRFLQKEFESIRSSHIVNDALWYLVDLQTDLTNLTQREYIDKAKVLVEKVSNLIGATLSDDNDYETTPDESIGLVYKLEKAGYTADWTVSIPRGTTTKSDGSMIVTYQMITYFRSESKELVDKILNLELLPYQRYVMGVPAGTFFDLDSVCSIRFRDLTVRGNLHFDPVIELTSSAGMYHVHDCISARDCVRLLSNKASGIILDLYNRVMSKDEDYVRVDSNLHLTITPNVSSIRQWSPRDLLPED